MNRIIAGEPSSVLNARACAICWRPLEGTYYRQTLDEVSRWLCTNCATRMFPKLPPKLTQAVGSETPNIVELDARALAAEMGIDLHYPHG